MESLQVPGNKVAGTTILWHLGMAAINRGYEHQLSLAVLGNLDPDGWHVVCLRSAETLGMAPGIDPNGVDVMKGTLALNDLMPCEIMLKMKDRDAGEEAPRLPLDIRLEEYLALDDIPGGYYAEKMVAAWRKKGVRDGQRRKR